MTALDLEALWALLEAAPLQFRGRLWVVMSPEIKEVLSEFFRTRPGRDRLTPIPLPGEPTTSQAVLMGYPIKLVEGFNGIAIEIEGIVRPDGRLQ
jgi:hypothetical protein